MKETFKLGAILFGITAVCAGLLGLVNSVTKPLIIERKAAATTAAIQNLLPNAEVVTTHEKIASEDILELYTATQNGTYIGAVAKVAPNGYGDVIELLVGVNAQLEVTGIEVLSHAETPGLGANLENEQFITQFPGKMQGLTAVKGQAGANEIAAITGATITSQAVVEGVNLAVQFVQSNLDQLVKESN